MRKRPEPVSIEDVVVVFTHQEWALLDLAQKILYMEVMAETFRNLESTGQIPFLLGRNDSHQIPREYLGCPTRRNLSGNTEGSHYYNTLSQIPHHSVLQRSVLGINNLGYCETGKAIMDHLLQDHVTGSNIRNNIYYCPKEGTETHSLCNTNPRATTRNEKKPQVSTSQGKESMEMSAFLNAMKSRSNDPWCNSPEKPSETHIPSSSPVLSATFKNQNRKTYECVAREEGVLDVLPSTPHMETESGHSPHEWKGVGDPFLLPSVLRQICDESHSMGYKQCDKNSKGSHLAVQKGSHMEGKNYNDLQCEKGFSCHPALSGHLQTHRERQEFGTYLSTTSYPTSHKPSHQVKRPYQCSECGKLFNRAPKLKIHMRTHTGEKPYQCKECGKSFRRDSHLYYHKQTHTGERPYPCQQCGKSFRRAAQLQRHMQIHTGEKPYTCKECGKSFRRDSHLHQHMRTHTGEKPYPCKECGKSFTCSSHLRVHVRTHTGERPYQCTECEKSFIQSTQFHVHMQSHTGERPYQCKECGKSFICSSYLRMHMRTHTAKRPFPCKECDKCYRNASSLGVHMRTHTGERPYPCTQCGKSFRRAAQLQRHLRTHTGEKPYPCKECGKSFSRASTLSVHMRTHTGERPYQCKECEKSFSQVTHLIVHMRIHTGERPYQCHQCEKSFTQASKLQRHLGIHTGERAL